MDGLEVDSSRPISEQTWFHFPSHFHLRIEPDQPELPVPTVTFRWSHGDKMEVEGKVRTGSGVIINNLAQFIEQEQIMLT